MPSPSQDHLKKTPVLTVEKGGKAEVIYAAWPKQLAFHRATARNVILAGGGGSGKTKAIRMDAIMRGFMIPGHRSLIVRRTMPELRLSHLAEIPYERQQLGLPENAWHSTTYVLRLPNNSTVEFGHVEDDLALPRYLSSEYEAIYFDELGTFTHKQFAFLCSRLRTTIPGLTPMMRGGTNPIGIGAGWVKRFFVDKCPSGKETEDYDPADYEYIHSTVDDNPSVDRTEYEKRLKSLPSDAMRRAMRWGEWTVEGQFFSEWDAERHVIGSLPTYHGRPIIHADHVEIVRVLDWGYSAAGNPGLCTWYACLPDGSAIGFQEYVFKETLPEEVAKEILRRSQGLRVRYTVGDTAMWQEHLGPSIAETMAGAGLGMIEADKQRENGWIEVHEWLRTDVYDGANPRPRITFLEGACPNAIRTLPNMVVDPKNPADMETRNVEDEAADVLRYFVMSRPGRSREPAEAPRIKGMMAKILDRQKRQDRLGVGNTRRRW